MACLVYYDWLIRKWLSLKQSRACSNCAVTLRVQPRSPHSRCCFPHAVFLIQNTTSDWSTTQLPDHHPLSPPTNTFPPQPTFFFSLPSLFLIQPSNQPTPIFINIHQFSISKQPNPSKPNSKQWLVLSRLPVSHDLAVLPLVVAAEWHRCVTWWAHARRVSPQHPANNIHRQVHWWQGPP